MMMPFPVPNSFARFTLLEGDASLSTSKSGILSPTFTKTADDAWKAARDDACSLQSRAVALIGLKEDNMITCLQRTNVITVE